MPREFNHHWFLILIWWSSSLRTFVIFLYLLITFFSNNFNVFLPSRWNLRCFDGSRKDNNIVNWTELNWMTHITVTLTDMTFRTYCPEQSCKLTDAAIKYSVLIGARVRKTGKTNISFVMPVCLSVYPYGWNNTAPNGRIFIKSDTWVFFVNLSKKFKFH